MSLFNISYTLDTDTNTITNQKVVEVTKVTVTDKPKAKAAVSQTAAVSLVGATLQLTQEVLTALNVEVGDKIAIVVDKDSITLMESTKGNVLTKKLTVSCKGKNQEAISAIGTEFTFEKKDDLLYLKAITNKDDGGSTEVDDFDTLDQEVKKSVATELGDAMEDFDFDFEDL